MRIAIALGVAVLLGACGGDDDGSGAGVDGGAGADATPGGPDAAPPQDYCAPTADWPAASVTIEDRILVLVNEARAEGATCGEDVMPPVGPLVMNEQLRCAARVHSLDMVTRDFFDHTNPDGLLPWDRMELAGYAWSSAGENIAAGNEAASAIMNQWMNSPGHCRNIMSGDYQDIGVGYYMLHSTQVFGTQ